jgi:PAS domain S-box-containing protein
MSQALRVLLVEDNPRDAELIVAELHRAGLAPDWQRVDTEPAYLAALDGGCDIILTDYDLPQFSGLRALELLQLSGRDIPLIVVSGTIGEDIAVAAMQQGATDYLLKDRLQRLAPAVNQALEQSQLRRERKQAEEARVHREAELKESQRIARIGSWEWTPATGVVTWSDGMNHILVRDPGSPAPTFETLPQFYTPESWQRLSAVIARAVEAGVAYDLELEMIRTGGAICWTITRGEAIRGADGTVVKLRGTMLDITERKQAEAALRESEATFRTLFEQAMDGMLLADAETKRFTLANRQIQKLLGYSQEELLQLAVADLHPATELPPRARAVREDGPTGNRRSHRSADAAQRWHGVLRRHQRGTGHYAEPPLAAGRVPRHHRAQAGRGGAAAKRGALPPALREQPAADVG